VRRRRARRGDRAAHAQPLLAPQWPIAKGGGSCETDAKKEEDEPDDGSEDYDCGGHWAYY
jgi:hypothetical protein